VSVVALTADYESWLGARIPLVAADLSHKHAEMAGSELRFLRGTYYLWLRRMGELLPELMDRPAVALVGDLHVENFGTWRDGAGVRRWGVNDFDELAWGSYAIDLVRLATSIVLTPELAVSTKDAVALLLQHWHSGEPGPAIEVDDADAAHLRRLTPAPAGAAKFYGALAGEPKADLSVIPDAVRAAVLAASRAIGQPLGTRGRRAPARSGTHGWWRSAAPAPGRRSPARSSSSVRPRRSGSPVG
jgi:hypothetical protein